jgi:hypothetical protein
VLMFEVRLLVLSRKIQFKQVYIFSHKLLITFK